MQLTGVTDLIGLVDLNNLPGGEWMLGLIIVAVSVLLSTFISNTATANLIVPVAMALSVGGPQTQGELAILAAFACSFAMAMPMSTPPNAIAFATGRIPVAAMLRVGGLITLSAALMTLLGYKLMIPLVVQFG